MSVRVRLLECLLQLQKTFQLTSYPPKAVLKVFVSLKYFHRTICYPPKLLFKQVSGTRTALLVLF